MFEGSSKFLGEWRVESKGARKPPSRLLARRPRMSACGISIFQHGRHHDYPDIERAGRPDIE